MARLWYGGTPADFVIAQGAEIPILDEAGVPTGDDGATVVLPLVATAFTAYLDAALTIPEDDLLDASGGAITAVEQSVDFATRGTIPRFQCVDGHEGPIWLSADGVTGYRLEPESDTLYGRVGVVETAVDEMVTTDLQDWSATPPTNGQVPVFNTGTGEWTPGAAAGTGTVTSVAGVSPTAGDVPTASLMTALAAATAAEVATVRQVTRRVLIDTGSGYPSKNGWTYGNYVGATEPVSGVVDGDAWDKPETTPSP